MREWTIKNNQLQILQIEDVVKYSLKTIEKAYFFFGESIAANMESGTQYLLGIYHNNPSFGEWDFQALKEMLGMDIYIINDRNVVTHSSYKDDHGLDFSVCCKKLAAILEERRAAGQFFADGIDIEQATGEIKKYSYMATPDKKYLIQLGYSLQGGAIFEQFNFLKVIEEMMDKYPSINDIQILNTGGNSLGNPADGDRLSEERRAAFEYTLQSQQTTEVKDSWSKEPAIYRYVHYDSEFDTSATQSKVLEIVYNEHDLQSILGENKQTFFIHLFILFIVTTAASFTISRWMAKPLYLAFHDSLTGLNNRAAFDEMLVSVLKNNRGMTALLMIDLDNFKLVNDLLGHQEGDSLLKNAARSIRSVARKEDITIRLGGDEFVMIMPNTSKEQAEGTAKEIIAAMRNSSMKKTEFGLPDLEITISIGISLAPEHGTDPIMLSRKADIALYVAKNRGKNQVQFYSDDFIYVLNSPHLHIE